MSVVSDWSFYAPVVLPTGLGLPGFVEPCAVGGHLVFLNLLRNPSPTRQWMSLLLFLSTRTVVVGVIGVTVVAVREVSVVAQCLTSAPLGRIEVIA